MSKSYELIKKVINDGKYIVLEDDGDNISIRYQLNVIHISPSKGDDNFVSVLLPNFSDVNEENFAEVVMRCHKLNEQMKQVKLYTINDVLIAASEFFYMGEEDLAYLFKLSLRNVIAAKVNYKRLDA